MKLTNQHLENIKLAVDSIYGAFPWRESDEGSDYWRTVVNKLNAYMDRAEKSANCQAEIAELKRRIAELEARC